MNAVNKQLTTVSQSATSCDAMSSSLIIHGDSIWPLLSSGWIHGANASVISRNSSAITTRQSNTKKHVYYCREIPSPQSLPSQLYMTSTSLSDLTICYSSSVCLSIILISFWTHLKNHLFQRAFNYLQCLTWFFWFIHTQTTFSKCLTYLITCSSLNITCTYFIHIYSVWNMILSI